MGKKLSSFLVLSVIDRMASTSFAIKTSCSFAWPQEAECCTKSSFTNWGGTTERQANGGILCSRGIQFCVHMCVVSPSPIRLIRPWTRLSLPSKIATPNLGGIPSQLSLKNNTIRGITSFKNSGYSRIWISQDSPCLTSEQNSMSLKPSPPKYFSLVITSQETQLVFLSPCLLPHQNILIRALICWQSPWGNLKHDIEHVPVW